MGKKRYTHVFWDWNGTIVDDLDINYNVINVLLRERGKSNISISEYRSAFSFPIKNFYGRIGLPIDGDEYEQLVFDYWKLYGCKIKDIPLMGGISEILDKLHKNGVKQYILSASDKIMIMEQMTMYGIKGFFDNVIAPQDGYAFGKIELAKQWLLNQDISTSDVIMIGDTFHDYETAKAINVDCALVDRGHQELSSIKCDSKHIIYSDVKKLSDHIFGL